MTSNDLKIIFNQNSHEIDVEVLIACLMRTSNIIQEVNRGLDTDKQIEVKIKALEKGSFEIHIELIEKLLGSLFSNDSVTYGAAIISITGGIYKLVKFLRGEKPKKIEQDGSHSRVTNYYGETKIFNNSVINIYNDNPAVRDNVSKQFSAIEKYSDIKGIDFVSDKERIVIGKEDFNYLSAKLDKVDKEDKQPIVTTEERQNILIIRPSFAKDLKWDFVYKEQKISAKMQDEILLDIVNKGERFAKGDCLLVDLEITKFYDEEMQTYLLTNNSYKITAYREHIKSNKQNRLF